MENDEKLRTVRERVTLAIGAARRAATALRQQRYILLLAEPALADAQQWQAGSNVSARRLYEHIHPLIERIADDELTGKELAAASAIVYALYYVTWHARREEGTIGPPLPNDICDISEETLDDCLEYAAQSQTP